MYIYVYNNYLYLTHIIAVHVSFKSHSLLSIYLSINQTLLKILYYRSHWLTYNSKHFASSHKQPNKWTNIILELKFVLRKVTWAWRHYYTRPIWERSGTSSKMKICGVKDLLKLRIAHTKKFLKSDKSVSKKNKNHI